MGNGYVDVPLREVKSRMESKLKEGQKLCESSDCYRRIKSQEKYCDGCQLTHYSGTYTKPCLVCPRKILKTSNSGYCDFHNKTCLGCSTRIAGNQTYCSYHESCLSKLRQYKNISDIQGLETFETWFNGNCGYVISGSSSYSIWIVIYEPKQWNKEISENLSAIKYKDSYSYLPSARNKAQELKSKLQSGGWYDTPMLEVHPKDNSYEYFSSLITSPYVVKNEVGSWNPSTWLVFSMHNGGGTTPSNLDRYFKPLDIVQIKQFERDFGVRFYHVGIYLGDVGNGNRICHFSRESNGVRLASWSEFLSKDRIGELYRYHPTIPFKNTKRIAEQITWTYSNNFWENQYDLRNRNCEHFANMLVYGINYSKQVEDNKIELAASVGVPGAVVAGGFTGAGLWNVIGSIALAPATGGASLLLGAASVGAAGAVVATALNVADGYAEINNGKGSTIKLTNEMNESNNKLGESSNKLADDIKANIEVPPKEHCRIM